MGSGSTKSYHITKNDVVMWPMAGLGEYCINQSNAVKELKKFQAQDKNGVYELCQADPVWQGWRIVGLYQGTMKKINL